jgi:hypothetical protein
VKTADTADPALIEALCAIMARYGVTELKTSPDGTVVLVRPPFAAMAPDKKNAGAGDDDADDIPDELARIQRMSPEEQDRALALRGAAR